MSLNTETVPWSTLKALLAAVSLDIYYISTAAYYCVYTSGNIVRLMCVLPRDGDSDVVDFETNYKAGAVDFFYTEINSYHNITGNSTVVVKSGAGLLRAISLNNNSTGGRVTVYDNTAGSGTKIATIQVGSPSGGLLSSTGLPGPTHFTGLDIRFNTGLTIVTSGSTNNDMTVYYR